MKLLTPLSIPDRRRVSMIAEATSKLFQQVVGSGRPLSEMAT
jgi:hypothetical protein